MQSKYVGHGVQNMKGQGLSRFKGFTLLKLTSIKCFMEGSELDIDVSYFPISILPYFDTNFMHRRNALKYSEIYSII